MKCPSYYKVHFKETWEKTITFLLNHIISEVLFIVSSAVLGYFREIESSKIFSTVLYAFSAIGIIFFGVLIYNFILAPCRIYKKKMKEIDSLQDNIKVLENRQSVNLEIKFDEAQLKYVCVDGETDSATYVYESIKYRVSIYNNSETQTIKNVEARITGIEGCDYWLTGKLPISLNCNGKERFDIHAEMEVPVNIVIWEKDTRWDGEETFAFCTNKKLKIPEGSFPISLTVSGENVASAQKRFIINLKYHDEGDLKKKISMKEC